MSTCGAKPSQYAKLLYAIHRGSGYPSVDFSNSSMCGVTAFCTQHHSESDRQARDIALGITENVDPCDVSAADGNQDGVVSVPGAITTDKTGNFCLFALRSYSPKVSIRRLGVR